MAHDRAVRVRARDAYLAGQSLQWISKRTGVSRATLNRWSRGEDWAALRSRARQIEEASAELILEMTRAAQESRDPQQAYAAMHAARLSGLAEAQPVHPAPEVVVKAMLGALSRDPEFGPLVRRRRKDVIDLVLREVEHLEVAH